MRVLVTGMASGIGHAVAAELRHRGEDVAGIDRQPGSGITVADIRDQKQVSAAAARVVDELGGLDILINNAGVGLPQDSGAPPDDDTLAMLETNVLGAWRVTAAAMPELLRSRGRVINIASGLARVNVPLSAGYAASKRALAAYSDVLRMEYGDRIAVTTIYPGFVWTPIHQRSLEMGLWLADAMPEESIDAVARVIVRACYGRARRDVPTSFPSAAAMSIARHLPRLADQMVRWRFRRLVRQGGLARSDLAAGLVERMLF